MNDRIKTIGSDVCRGWCRAAVILFVSICVYVVVSAFNVLSETLDDEGGVDSTVVDNGYSEFCNPKKSGVNQGGQLSDELKKMASEKSVVAQAQCRFA